MIAKYFSNPYDIDELKHFKVTQKLNRRILLQNSRYLECVEKY